MTTPLAGIRVLDLTHALAGPYCTMLLADFGATVYKLEPPGGGDMGRGWGPPFTGDQASYFLGLNAGKLGVCIDLRKPEGLRLCRRMLERVDVLIENMRPGTLDRLGLGYAAVRPSNPRLVYCSISGYGQTGPARDDPAMDLIVQASSGLMSITGTAAGETVRSGHSVADTTAGLFAVIGILMALRVREQTGVGQFVDISMLDGLVSTMASSYANFCGSGILPKPLGTAFASVVPYRTFRTRDRDVAIAIGSEKLWALFCGVIGRTDLAVDPDYATNALRIKNRAVLEPLLEDIFLQFTAEEWGERLGSVGIPYSLVRNAQEVFDDPQIHAREMFQQVGGFPVTGVPFQLSETPGRVGRPAPHLGEHTRIVLSELLEMNDAELDGLARSAVIFGHYKDSS